MRQGSRLSADIQTGSMDRNKRTVSFLAAPDADEYPVLPLMLLLSGVSFCEGLDACLFPSTTKALEEAGFDVGIISYLATFQLIFQAVAGPTWGVIASRGMLTRKTILCIATFLQGAATLVMWIYLNVYVMAPLRAINGIALAGLRPIANSIVGDRFDDNVRGKYFGMIMSAMQFGVTVGTAGATTFSRQKIWDGFGGMGWQLSFVAVGLFTIALVPAIVIFGRFPPVRVAAAAEDSKQGGGLGGEFQALARLFKKPTFAMLVFQGCFGLIPWRAFDFRGFFLQTAGISDGNTAIINVAGGLGATVGSYMGGPIGDGLNRVWPLHGRVLNAEIAVYGGIPIAYFSFMVLPASVGFPPFWYYFVLTLSLGLIATWTPAGTNSPVLCSLAAEDERALILSWQTSLEGSIGAFGPLLFAVLLKNVFGYDPECNRPENKDREDCKNVGAAGSALFWTSCVPWTVCGLMYSSLHCTYPRDLATLEKEREEAGGAAGMEMPLAERTV